MNRIASRLDQDIDPEHDPRYTLIPSNALPRSGGEALESVDTVRAQIAPESRLIMYNDPYSLGADRFRMLRMYFRALGEAGQLKTLMVTSALPGEGKSLTALNLSIGLAERTGSSVILVEADLRYPSLAHTLGLENWPGLAACLEQDVDPIAGIRYVSPLGIYLLPAGDTVANPIQLLSSERLVEMIRRLRSMADWVILDCPPVVPVPDVLALRGNVDGCLWVVRAGHTPRDVVKEAICQVGKEMVLGVVLNQAEVQHNSVGHYYGCVPPGVLTLGS